MNLLKNNWQKFFCIFLFAFSLILLVVVFIKNPMSIFHKKFYLENSSSKMEDISFPIIQYLDVEDKTNQLNLYFGDSLINNYEYNVKLVDDKEKIYFEDDFLNYKSDSISLNIDSFIEKGKYKLIIECASCDNIKLNLVSASNYNRIENNFSKSLNLEYVVFKRNYNYYWYCLMGMLISLSLYPMIEVNSDEKK